MLVDCVHSHFIGSLRTNCQRTFQVALCGHIDCKGAISASLSVELEETHKSAQPV